MLSGFLYKCHMKRLIPFFFLISLNALAICDLTDKVYLAESDDEGTTLDLAYSCTGPERTDVCVYKKDKLVSIAGSAGYIALNSAEVYKRKITEKDDVIDITVKSGFFDSFFDYQYMNIKLDKNTMTGVLKYGGRGLSPILGTKSAYRTKEIFCVQE